MRRHSLPYRGTPNDVLQDQRVQVGRQDGSFAAGSGPCSIGIPADIDAVGSSRAG